MFAVVHIPQLVRALEHERAKGEEVEGGASRGEGTQSSGDEDYRQGDSYGSSGSTGQLSFRPKRVPISRANTVSDDDTTASGRSTDR